MEKRFGVWAMWGVALLLSACGGATDIQSVPTDALLSLTVEPTPTVTPPISVPTIVVPGPCQHLLWPLVDGAVWEYQLTSADGSVQPVTVTASVSDASADLLHNEARYRVTCQPDGLYGIYGPLLGYSGSYSRMVLSAASGPFLPSPDRLLPLGTEVAWDVEFAVSGELSLPLVDNGAVVAQVIGGKVVLFVTTEQPATVNVPAGSFEALPVLQSVFFDLRVTTADGRSGSVIGDARSRLYLAEGVGLVRRVFEGGTLSGTLDDVPFGAALSTGVSLDLQSFSGSVSVP